MDSLICVKMQIAPQNKLLRQLSQEPFAWPALRAIAELGYHR